MNRFVKLDAQLKHIESGPHAAVLDTETNLIWKVDYVTPERLTHAKAITAAAAVTLGDATDWRLPTIKELLSIVDYDRSEPAIDTDAFPGAKPNYTWSSSPVAGLPDYAWDVYFSNGYSSWDNRSNYGFVRAVRGPVLAGQ